MAPQHYVRALTIAGSDSGGGAGIQADLKTFAALGCYGMSVVTALTAQNTVRVASIHEVPARFVAEQIEAVLGDIGADAVKIGMLQTPEVIRTVARGLRGHGVSRIVLDPVMVAKSGDRLLREEAIDALKQELLPIAEIITPNLPEASVLCGESVAGRLGMEQAARKLVAMGSSSVLLKGGHSGGSNSADVLCGPGSHGAVEIRWFDGKRYETTNTHGTGCTLSSAIAAFRAHGLELPEAVAEAKRYSAGAIEAGSVYRLGRGHGPVHHFYRVWDA